MGDSRPADSQVLSSGLGAWSRYFCACAGPREVVSRERSRTLGPGSPRNVLGLLMAGSLWGAGERTHPHLWLQASRKAGTRSKAAATKQAQRGSSNVFSMFEQAQIQEFKEVSAPLPLAWAPSGHHAPNTSLLPCRSGVLAPVFVPPKIGRAHV